MKRNAVAWAALLVSSAALVNSQGFTRRLPAAPKISTEAQKTARALSEAYQSVAEFVKPSVVQISVEKKAGARNLQRGRRVPMPGAPNGPQGMIPKEFEDLLRRFFDQEIRPEQQQFSGPGEGTGSGFVYDDRGHIVTNNHVVDSAAKITVTFSDGVEASAKVVGVDPQSDVAVIKVETTNYPPLPRGQSGKLKVGELVMAVGSPFGLSQSVTTGIISATERNDLFINGTDAFESFLQTDAAINPGNSGGPLVNMDGQVVGVNSAIVTGGRGNDGVGFSIPIDMASAIADNLIKNGKMKRSRVGIALEPLTPVMAKQLGVDPKTKGVLVGDVLKGSPADKAGLKAGDVITGFNGAPVVSVPTFRLTVSSSDSGKELGLKYVREGKERSTTIVPAPSDEVKFAQERENTPKVETADKPETEKGTNIDDFGLEVQPVTPELAAQFGHAKDAKGLLISDVKEGSAASVAGLTPGLLITRIVKDQKVQSVTAAEDFRTLAGKSDEIAVYVEAPNKSGRFVTLSKLKKD